ncbi:hypothetical protein PF008_g20325 [Phytophthora fragariae]|uniref:Fe2OG dioxygenase domain-containing protein n=1 Tax=Phytophthora fragariae TaxID=53985 RepID=A0A6G0QZU8_9STRA|nr:hypothetical protein PF008_g20325 [Phytophthora fragariae]
MSDEEDATSSPELRWPFGCEGEDNDVLTPKGETCAKLSRLLEKAEVAAGEFSFGGVAASLPAIPGLVVDGVGSVPVPLTEERKDKLLALGEKITSGQEECWKIQADQVQMKNPKWVNGILKLGGKVGDRLGFKRIKLSCKLKELLVYGPGAKRNKHQEVKEDGVVATVEVQLPSEHSGGTLVVYRGRDLQFRHDFGTEKGAAAYLPHYAAYFVDAPHAREEMTSGFQLMLKYSLSLPPEMRHLEDAKSDKPLSEELAEVLKGLEPDDDCFGLLLESKYAENVILGRGVEALSEMDKTRYRALLEANSLILEDKALVFYIARLNRWVKHYDGRLGSHKDPRWKERYAIWQSYDRKDEVTWYSIDGKKYGHAMTTMYTNTIKGPKEKDAVATFKPTFLNLGRLQLSQLWKSNGHSIDGGGGEDRMKTTELCRYAVFAWPKSKNIDYSFKFVNNETAAAALQAQEFVDADILRQFMERASTESAKKREIRQLCRRFSYRNPSADSSSFFQMMVGLIVKCEDATLVGLLFEKFFNGATDNKCVGGICSLINAFKWENLKDAVLSILRTSSKDRRYGWEAEDDVRLTLQLVDNLERGEAQTALLAEAVERVMDSDPEQLARSSAQSLLWKCVIQSDESAILTNLVEHFQKIKPADLKPVLKAVSEHVASLDTNDKKFKAIASIATLRMEWLNQQIDKLDRPFTWEMPNALFIDNARVQAFLRGLESTMTTQGLVYFRNLKHAQRWTRHARENASFKMIAEGTGRDAFVRITKTRQYYEQRQTKATNFKAEKEELLAKRFNDPANNNSRSRKRPREERIEETEDVVME